MRTVINGVTVVMPAPDGYEVDFDNPQRHYLMANYLAAGLGMSFAFFFLLQRMYVKLTVQRSFGVDDYCCVAAWAFTVAMQGLLIHGFAEGLYGVHAWEISIEKFGTYNLMANYVQAIIYVFPTLLSKLCLLIFYIKLQNRHFWYQFAVWSTIFVTVGSNLGILFSVAFACNPIAMAYDVTVTEGSCVDRPAVFKATAAFGIITDVLIFLIPIPMVISLRLSRRKKMGLMAVFAIGSATVITSIVRLILLMLNLSKPDLPWIGGPIFLWISIESNLLIICSCLPTLKAFVQAVTPRLWGQSSDRGANSASKYGPNSADPGSSFARGALQSISRSRPKPKRDEYYGFDNDDTQHHRYRMETLFDSGASTETKKATSSTGFGVTIAANHGEGLLRDASSGRSIADKDQDEDQDDDSIKGIVHTKTVQISYDDHSV